MPFMLEPNLNHERSVMSTVGLGRTLATGRSRFNHHWNSHECNKIPVARCYKNGHVGTCKQCMRQFNCRWGCDDHPYVDGHNLEAKAKFEGVSLDKLRCRYDQGIVEAIQSDKDCSNGVTTSGERHVSGSQSDVAASGSHTGVAASGQQVGVAASQTNQQANMVKMTAKKRKRAGLIKRVGKQNNVGRKKFAQTAMLEHQRR
ncbi:hypothetical protein NA57DRAFT_56653 [Rhizodiscina lignyota]|uniref:Uncharacterized protein n=1 Tax=Rhizodiscina lignyota TaxID=1504668 RepID=A0A9P4M6M6_9PEZI|nr:hypothetical protein NA57DRAFT_56653 [Rhizodiscina lignyota]